MSKEEKKVFEALVKCEACAGTGIYKGFGECKGNGVVCSRCDGKGARQHRFEYTPFTERKVRRGVKWVFEHNPGIGMDSDPKLGMGGMSYKDWQSGKPFPAGSEPRKYVCPAWYYQGCNYDLKPEWDICTGFGAFRNCDNFKKKASCWKRWDKEFGSKRR